MGLSVISTSQVNFLRLPRPYERLSNLMNFPSFFLAPQYVTGFLRHSLSASKPYFWRQIDLIRIDHVRSFPFGCFHSHRPGLEMFRSWTSAPSLVSALQSLSLDYVHKGGIREMHAQIQMGFWHCWGRYAFSPGLVLSPGVFETIRDAFTSLSCRCCIYIRARARRVIWRWK